MKTFENNFSLALLTSVYFGRERILRLKSLNIAQFPLKLKKKL